jgi:hypothetical protein
MPRPCDRPRSQGHGARRLRVVILLERAWPLAAKAFEPMAGRVQLIAARATQLVDEGFELTDGDGHVVHGSMVRAGSQVPPENDLVPT